MAVPRMTVRHVEEEKPDQYRLIVRMARYGFGSLPIQQRLVRQRCMLSRSQIRRVWRRENVTPLNYRRGLSAEAKEVITQLTLPKLRYVKIA